MITAEDWSICKHSRLSLREQFLSGTHRTHEKTEARGNSTVLEDLDLYRTVQVCCKELVARWILRCIYLDRVCAFKPKNQFLALPPNGVYGRQSQRQTNASVSPGRVRYCTACCVLISRGLGEVEKSGVSSPEYNVRVHVITPPLAVLSSG